MESIGSRIYVRSKGKRYLFADKDEKYKEYYIHSNRERPFIVKISKRMLVCLRSTDEKVMYIAKHPEVFIGKHKHNSERMIGNKLLAGYFEKLPKGFVSIGNTILVGESDGYYTCLNDPLVRFKPKEPILRYFSPIGNNDVPYPYALTEHYTYLIIDGVYIENSLRETIDPYDEYYGWIYKESERTMHKEKFKKFAKKIKWA